jgi:hypothetical protein
VASDHEKLLNANEASHFQLIQINNDDSLFTSTGPTAQVLKSPISELIGIPIVGRKLVLDPTAAPMQNDAASCFICMDPESSKSSSDYIDSENEHAVQEQEFGAPPFNWLVDVGPILLARLDQKPLHPLHAAAFLSYCRMIEDKIQRRHEADRMKYAKADVDDVFQDVLDYVKEEKYKDVAETVAWKKEVRDNISAEKFDEFFRAYRMRRATGSMQSLDKEIEEWVGKNENQRMGAVRPELGNVKSPYWV